MMKSRIVDGWYLENKSSVGEDRSHADPEENLIFNASAYEDKCDQNHHLD
jgi:hypothetical protein